MATAPESAALVALLRVGRRPWPEYSELLEQLGSAGKALEQELTDTNGQTSLLPRDPDPLIAQASSDIAGWQAAGIELLTVLDRDYPDNLKAVHDRPPLLFVDGALTAQDSRAIAVIGTRAPSPSGLRTARRAAQQLVAGGFTVVSGLAAGIDTAAHTAALQARHGRTVAVVGTGVKRSYPPQNAALQRTIAERGAVVSQFWPDAPPTRQSFPLRNATMSGLALATVVIEASARSGARIQARRALAHGRPVFLQRQVLAEPWANALAQRPGTHVIDDPEEIASVVDRLTDPGTLIG
jgi:DNA processing protein